MRGAWGLGDPEVRVAIDVDAPRRLEPLVRLSYGPLVALLVRRLAAVAQRA